MNIPIPPLGDDEPIVIDPSEHAYASRSWTAPICERWPR